MNVRKIIIERIIITGKIETRERAWKYVDKHDYKIIRSGPMVHRDHTADTARYKIIAERELVI